MIVPFFCKSPQSVVRFSSQFVSPTYEQEYVRLPVGASDWFKDLYVSVIHPQREGQKTRQRSPNRWLCNDVQREGAKPIDLVSTKNSPGSERIRHVGLRFLPARAFLFTMLWTNCSSHCLPDLHRGISTSRSNGGAIR